MVTELKRSMDKVVLSTGIDNQRQLRTKYFSRSLVIIYTLQTTLDFDNGKDLAIKLFQIYEFCRQQLIKCFREQIIEGLKKAMGALEEIFGMARMNAMQNNQQDSVNSQLDKLEKISNQISILISSGQYEKINHLDKMRKKIIADMNAKNYNYSNHKKTVLNLISEQNQRIITEFKESEEKSFQNFQNKKNVPKSLSGNFLKIFSWKLNYLI